MFFRSDQPHGLKRHPFNAIVVPRPIGWISSVNPEGRVNLAPYSFFNGVAYIPPQVMFAATGNHDQGGLKDSVRNVETTGEFVVNLATWSLREQMNMTAIPAPHGVDEFEIAGLTKAPAELVSAPRVAGKPGPSGVPARPDGHLAVTGPGRSEHRGFRRSARHAHRRVGDQRRPGRLREAAGDRPARLQRLRPRQPGLHHDPAEMAAGLRLSPQRSRSARIRSNASSCVMTRPNTLSAG